MGQTLEKQLRETTDTHETLAQTVFDYMKLNQPVKKTDLIYLMGSMDTLPAERAADLFLDGWAPYFLISGGAGGRNYQLTPQECEGLTEARMLADVALKMGVPEDKILLEDESQNSGQNIEFSRELLKREGIHPKEVLAVHMPSAERRDRQTITSYWPDVEVTMASPRVPFSEYHKRGYQGQMDRYKLIADMLGDFQRMFVFPRKDLGFGFVNPIDELPSNSVLFAYHNLVSEGYTSHLIKYQEKHADVVGSKLVGEIIPVEFNLESPKEVRLQDVS